MGRGRQILNISIKKNFVVTKFVFFKSQIKLKCSGGEVKILTGKSYMYV